jgi:2-C-methyl-D-erythritol 4-phosphate cytidylyltransferase
MESGVGVVLVAAGAGVRFGSPKAGVLLSGVPLVERAARAFAGFPDRVVVLRREEFGAYALPGWREVEGGARRRDSVARGVEALGPGTALVLVHDAARPLVPAEVVSRVLRAARETGAAIPVLPLHDTVKQVEGGRVRRTLDRRLLAAVQTPQGFRTDLLRRALLRDDEEATDDAALVEALGAPVAAVPGDPRCLKITTPLDLLFAEALLADGDLPLE